MKFTRSTYPDFPGAGGSPCWKIKGKWVDVDADWNTRFPFGTSLSVHVGRQPPPRVHEPGCPRLTRITAEGISGCQCEFKPNPTPGFLIDLNAPLGEPNRLYLWAGPWHVILGLPEFRNSRPTGEESTVVIFGREIPSIHMEYFTNWRPHIAGCGRYKYHQDPEGKWVRDEKPAPGHWGWLTVTRRDR
jgi:hypothetical protein